jgi:cyclopropane fatty-acyl-phospholipid synthase-like methyltransferase
MSKSGELASKQEVKIFYNTFKEHQKKLGVNIRHRTIFRNLKKIGLKPDSHVLEIGCGIGTVSSLILSFLKTGSFVGVDISEESIKLAKEMNSKYTNTEFIVNDMSSFQHKTRFDFVVLPDVLEHIPVEEHFNLFSVISRLTTENAMVLINIPEPDNLNWVRKTHPEKLQIIDQSLSMQDLLNNSYPHGFVLVSMNSYALQYSQPDYTSVVLKKKNPLTDYSRQSRLKLGLENLKSILLK